MAGSPICEEKRRLMDEYADATKAFSDSVERLRMANSRRGFEDVLSETEKARANSASARKALEHHLYQHHC